MITARDIADQVGVSISTVGRAMADDPRISAETKAKVLKAAARLGYAGNMMARVVRGGRSNLLGLIIPDVQNDFYAAIAQALSQTCDREGYRLVLSIAADDRDLEARHVRELVGARVAGIIVVPTASPKRECVQMIQGVAHVQLLRRVPSLGDAWFGIDDEEALRHATSHLLALGHRRIAYVGGHDTLSTGAARLRGYRRAVQEAGLGQDEAMVSLGPPSHQQGLAAIERLRTMRNPPSAIVSGSVHITLGMIEALETTRNAWVERLSIIGFGDPAWFSWWRGGITTVRPPVQELATACGLWFLNLLRTHDPLLRIEQHGTVAASALITRASTRPFEPRAPRGRTSI